MNMISTGAFQTEMDASNKQETLAEKFARVWEKKNAKIARAGGVSLMALSLAACGSSSDDADSGTATPVVTEPDPDPVVTPEPDTPSVGADEIDGTAAADTTTFRVVQNSLGAQTNQFGTGDQVSLGAGSDTINVKVQDASSLNDGPSASIAAELTSVETANFTALNDSDTGGADGTDIVEINGAFWLGTDVISSIASDASLTVYNVNTLNDDEAYGDVGELTSTMTIRMDHTGNDNNTNATAEESDMMVYFDEDYLIAGATSSSSSATYYILDQDGAQQNGTGTPLMHSVDANGQVDATGTTVAFTDSIGVSFALDGVAYSVSLTADQLNTAAAAATYTHTDFVTDLTANGGLPAGVTIAVDATNVRTTFLDDGTAYSIPAITLTSANGGVFTDQAFVSREATGVEFNEFGRFENIDPTTSGAVEINVELEKVGRDGDGGDLVIGGMEDSGIDTFHVEVQGRADQPSSLASLSSTNNFLKEVYVEADTGAAASLEIGNGNTAGAVPNGATVQDGEVSSVMNNALVDVRVFDAATFDNGVTVHASVTDASVAKYMDRGDTAADPSADQASFAYSSGAGNDTFNVNVSQANLAASGTVNREDFAMSVASGDGNDSVTMQIGDGTGTIADAWWINHLAMDANADSRVGVDAGSGNDMVHTNGATIFRVDLGAGNDAGYTDNSGVQGDADVDFNGGRATFVLNTAIGNDIDNLVTDTNNNYALYQQTVNVDYSGYSVSSVITDYNTTDLEMNNIIKGLISGDEHLSDLIVAEDGPGNTLIIRSLIDGVQAVGDFTVSLTANAAIGATSTNTIGLFNTANSITDTTPTLAELQTAVDAGVAAWNASGDYTTRMATEHNAGAAVAAEVQTITVATTSNAISTLTVSIQNVHTDVAITGTQTVAEQSALIAAALEANAQLDGLITAVDNNGNNAGEVVVTFTGDLAGLNVDAITVTESVATASTYTMAEATAGSTDVEIVGANSTAENDNTITDGAGQDTIVLSTDATSNEQVVLVSDNTHDMIVNWASGDTINVDAYMTNAAATTTATVTDATGADGAAVTGVTADGGIVIDDADATNDTLAEIQALVTTADNAVSAAATQALYIVQDNDHTGGGDTGTVYLVSDGTAAADATVTQIDTLTILGVDIGGLVAADFVIA